MRTVRTIILLVGTLLAFLACGETPHNDDPVEVAGPALVSTSPADGTGDIVTASQSIVFTFDQNIVLTPEGRQGVSVDGGAFLDRVSPSGTDLTVVVAGLNRGSRYTVTLPAGTVRGYKQNQKASEAITYRFLSLTSWAMKRSGCRYWSYIPLEMGSTLLRRSLASVSSP